MATVSSLGSGSGLDLSGLLTSLMQAEQLPLVALQKKEASYQARISAYGSLKGALSSLQSAALSLKPGTGVSINEKYQTASATIADSTIASATATASAVAGVYNLEVTSLAKTHRLVSPDSTDVAGAAAVSSALTAGGSLKIELGSLSDTYAYTADASKELNVTIAAGSTLEQVRDAINTAATDGRVSATIINGTNGKQLVLTSGNSGTTNAMKLSGDSTLGTGFDFNPAGSAAGAGNLSQATAKGGQAATDAAFKLNGIAATSSSNTVSGVLDGITLTLTKETTTPTLLTVTKNQTSALTSALNAFVKSYNDANKTMSSLGAYNADTKTSSVLTGNSTLRSAQNQIRNLLFTAQGGTSAYQRLSDIGVSLAKDGTLSLDSTKLNKAISADFSGVANLVSKIGTAFNTGIDGLVSSTGSITTATDAANRQIKDVTAQQQRVSDRLVSIEARYRAQFTALDTLIAGMKQTSTYLTQQLANLPSLSSS